MCSNALRGLFWEVHAAFPRHRPLPNAQRRWGAVSVSTPRCRSSICSFKCKTIVCGGLLAESADQLKRGERWLRGRAGRDDGQTGEAAAGDFRRRPSRQVATPAQEKIREAVAGYPAAPRGWRALPNASTGRPGHRPVTGRGRLSHLRAAAGSRFIGGHLGRIGCEQEKKAWQALITG